MIDDANEVGNEYPEMWHAKLEKIGAHASYVASFAESFHVAGDEVCTAVLADAARHIMAESAIPA